MPRRLRKQKHGHYLEMTLGSAVLGDAQVKPRWRRILAGSQIGQRVDAVLGVDEDALLRHLEVSGDGDRDLFMAIIAEAHSVLQARNVDLAVVLLPGAGHAERLRRDLEPITIPRAIA